MNEEGTRLQRAMAHAVLGGDTADLLEQLADPPPGRDLAHRVSAYTGGYQARVEESLAEAYPALARVLGARDFHSLVERYLPCLPADEANLNYVGRDLAGFLSDDGLSAELPFAADLARLEWAVVECFHARWQPAADLSFLEDLGQERLASLRLEFQPAAALIVSDWPLKEIRDALEGDRDSIDIDLVGRPDRVLVYRNGYQVVTESVAPLEATAFDRLRAGATLGETVEQLEALGADGDGVAGMFTRWVNLSLVTGGGA